MATLVTDCPHCKAQMVGFTFTSSYAKPGSNSVTHYVTGSCNACHRPITASVTLENAGVWDPKNYQGDVLHSRGLRVNAIWPASEKITAPSSVPDKVARSYMEAAEARSRSSWNAACATYRRTMELALKAFAPEIDAWKLEKRIDKLAAEHRITTDIQTWAHELRLDGNEALHGDEDATPEMTEQMHHLTHFLLIYLYTLPKQIEAARERRDVEIKILACGFTKCPNTSLRGAHLVLAKHASMKIFALLFATAVLPNVAHAFLIGKYFLGMPKQAAAAVGLDRCVSVGRDAGTIHCRGASFQGASSVDITFKGHPERVAEIEYYLPKSRYTFSQIYPALNLATCLPTDTGQSYGSTDFELCLGGSDRTRWVTSSRFGAKDGSLDRSEMNGYWVARARYSAETVKLQRVHINRELQKKRQLDKFNGSLPQR